MALAGGGGAFLRIAAVALACLMLAATIVRNAAVSAWARRDPGAAAQWWPGHPEVQRAQALSGLGLAARSGQRPDAATRERLERVAATAPMAIEPLLVTAVAALGKGDSARAERLLIIARQRDARALPPHFFLAELYLRSGRIESGLTEIANLARLAPGGSTISAPFIAEFAREPGNWPRIRAVLERQPALAAGVLGELANDPANLRATLALAPPGQRGPDAAWLPPMIATLIKAGRAREARRLWERMSGVAPGGLLHDSTFSDSRSIPPFNWALAESAVGLAERQRSAGLHVIFHGSQGGVLAQQLLLLAPGDYRLGLRMRGTVADQRALEWTISCAGAPRPFANFPLTGPGEQSWRFRVAPGCGPQTLALVGRAEDIGGRSDVLISAMRLERSND